MSNVYTKPSDKYYIEKYVKCPLCGKLVYEDTFLDDEEGKKLFFCSEWCRNEYWKRNPNLRRGSACEPSRGDKS